MNLKNYEVMIKILQHKTFKSLHPIWKTVYNNYGITLCKHRRLVLLATFFLELLVCVVTRVDEDLMAMIPVCFNYRISGTVALWPSAIRVCWMSIWCIKVRQNISQHATNKVYMFLNVDCTIRLSLPLCQTPKLLSLYMKYMCTCLYTCIYIYNYIYMHISIDWCGRDVAPVRQRWSAPLLH